MSSIGFFVASLTTVGVSFFIIRGTSPQSKAGSNEYESLRNRRTFGLIVLVAAGLLLSIALLQVIFQD